MPRLDEGRSGWWRRPAVWVALAVTTVAFFTYFWGYWYPPHFFWDENYHVASAQKYLHGVFFMEPHPPLGKLLIALGEALWSPAANAASDQFISTDYAGELPASFSFAGFRFFPALFGWLTAPLLFSVLLLVVRNTALAGLATAPYVFDNALIVHSRAAMLEPVLLFFSLLVILLFLLLLEPGDSPRRGRWLAALFGASFAAVVTTKAVGLVLILLGPFLAWRYARRHGARPLIRDLALPAAAGFALVFVAVWQTHFSISATIDPALENEGYFRASPGYRQALENGRTGSLGNFGLMLRDSLAFMPHYAQGVPRLDLCKEDEAGSPWFLWPVGARAINYRWETDGGEAEATYRYLYLQSNPLGWALGLIGVVSAVAMLLASALLRLAAPLENRFTLLAFLALYAGYMFGVSRIDRVMYLYHYFLPLLISYILFALAMVETRHLGPWRVNGRRRVIAATLCMVAVFAGFLFFAPLTYYRPIDDQAFSRRAWLRIWDLRCERCERTSPLVGASCS